MSQTCREYPRNKRHYKTEIYNTLTLSCPTVVEQVLYDPDAMLYHERDLMVSDYTSNVPERTQAEKVVQLFVFHLINAQSPAITDNLRAVTHFILFLAKLEYQIERNFERIEHYFNSLISELSLGKLSCSTPTTLSSGRLKMGIISLVGGVLLTAHGRLPSYRRQIFQRLLAYFEVTDVIALSKQLDLTKLEQLEVTWQQLCLQTPWLSDPSVWRNFFLHQLYSTFFPQLSTQRPNLLRELYRLVIDYYYLRTALVMKATEGPLEKEDILLTVSSYSGIKTHAMDYKDQLDNVINAINGGDDITLLMLL